MNKSPAFQLYPDEWLGSTKIMLMTPAEEGAYIRLLCVAWNSPDCGLPDDDEQLAALSRLGKAWFKGSSTTLRACFVKRKGRLFNKRLLKERKKQREWKEKSSLGGRKSAKARQAKRLRSKGGSTVVDKCLQPNGNSLSLSPSLSPITSSIYKIPIPESLSSDGFQEKWNEWIQHRKEIKKPLKPTTAKKQLAKLERMGLNRALCALDHSMENGWTGIFEANDNRERLGPRGSKLL